MASKRSEIGMTPSELDEFLSAPRTLNVATLGPGGQPHLVAMWFGFIDGDRFSNAKIGFWTFGKSQKVMNLRRNPRMTCLVEAGTRYDQLQGVELVGTGSIVEDHETIMAIAVATSERHNGPITDEARSFMEVQARKRVGVVLNVESVVSWDHGKLAGRY